MPWETSLEMFVWIFNVGRGSAAFVRTPLNQGILIDISCSEFFSTSDFILDNLHKKLDGYKKNKIAQAILTHPHHDHISDCGPLSDNPKLYPTLVTCPNDKDPQDAVKWGRIKNRDGNRSLSKYKKLYEGRQLPLQTIQYDSSNTTAQELEYGIYYVRPSICDGLHKVDNEYGNSLSIVTYIRYGKNSILFPGDITPLAMERILNQSEGVEKRFTVFSKTVQVQKPKWTTETCDQPSLKGRLGTHGLSVLVASHHGLESCYSPELYAAIKGGKPDLVAISEAYAVGEGQGNIHSAYQSRDGANGVTVKTRGKDSLCYSATTKSNHILIRFNGSGVPRVYREERIEDLMKWANA
jgi:beta-lactamase superfamily II metal-dependent hydrolase